MADTRKSAKAPHLAGPLAWLVPGAGHYYLGMKARGIVLFVTITAMFWTGVLIGGLRSTVDPHKNAPWFMGEVGAGGNALLAVAINNSMNWPEEGYDGRSWGKARDIGVVYAGVAGLLNMLAVFDVLVRAMSGQVSEEKIEEEPESEESGEKKD